MHVPRTTTYVMGQHFVIYVVEIMRQPYKMKVMFDHIASYLLSILFDWIGSFV